MNKFLISFEEIAEVPHADSLPTEKLEPVEEAAAPVEDKKKSTTETELVAYCKIGYFEGLKLAEKKEQQEQYEIKSEQSVSGNKGCVRVRKTTCTEGVNFVLTNKIRSENENLSIAEEFNLDITEDYFNSFASIAPSKTVKDRYIFLSKNVTINVFGDDTNIIQVPELKFEVDVFPKEDGTYHEWCKIDIEIDPLLKVINESATNIEKFNLNIKINHLPFKPTESFIGSEATEEQKAILDNFYQNIFSIKQ